MGASQSNQIDPNNERNIELGAASGTADSIELVEASIEKASVAPALQLATPSASPSRRVLPLARLALFVFQTFSLSQSKPSGLISEKQSGKYHFFWDEYQF